LFSSCRRASRLLAGYPGRHLTADRLSHNLPGHPRFLRIAPLAALGIGTSFSLHGLWAAPWLTDVAGLDRGKRLDADAEEL
jgi:hypothetical protein